MAWNTNNPSFSNGYDYSLTVERDMVFQNLCDDKNDWTSMNGAELTFSDFLDSTGSTNFSQTDGGCVLLSFGNGASNEKARFTIPVAESPWLMKTKSVRIQAYIDLNTTDIGDRIECRMTGGSGKLAAVNLSGAIDTDKNEFGYFTWEFAISGMALTNDDINFDDIVEFQFFVVGSEETLEIYMDSIQVFENHPTPRCVLTFDDNTADLYDVARPLLNARGMKAHFYIRTDKIDEPGFMTAAQLLTLQEDGHLIGSHSVSHFSQANNLLYYEYVEEILEARRVLTNIGINEGKYYFAMPGGTNNFEVGFEREFKSFIKSLNYHVRWNLGTIYGTTGSSDNANVSIQFGQPNYTGIVTESPASIVTIFDTGVLETNHVGAKNLIDKIILNNGLLVLYTHMVDAVQSPTLTFDADFVEDNTIDLDINGVAITQVPWNSSHAQTVTDLSTAIEAHADVFGVVSSSGPRTFVITALDTNTSLGIDNIVVDVGASQADGTMSSNDAKNINTAEFTKMLDYLVSEGVEVTTFDKLMPWNSSKRLDERLNRKQLGF